MTAPEHGRDGSSPRVRIDLDLSGIRRAYRQILPLIQRWANAGRYATGPLTEYPSRAEHARARRMASWRRKRDIRAGRCPR